jgi:hypothetical protein
MTECGCVKGPYPLPKHVKVGAKVKCHNSYTLNLPQSLIEELACMADIKPEKFKINITKGTEATITQMDDRYITVELKTPGQPFDGPWFDKQLRGDFAWYWCGTAEDALSRMMGVPTSETVDRVTE